MYGRCTLLATACLSLYLYLPLRSLADPPVDWGNPESWQGFVDVVLRRQYSLGPAGTPRSLTRIAAQSMAFLGLYAGEFTPWLCWLPVVGAGVLWRRDRLLFALCTLTALVSSLGLAILLNFDINRQSLWLNNVFWIPTYLICALGIGLAVGALARAACLAARCRSGCPGIRVAEVPEGFLPVFAAHGLIL